MPHGNRTDLLELTLVVVSLLGMLMFSFPARERVLDDAYITFRFADHLRANQGLVWNVGGERTEGFSSPLHVLVCAVGLLAGWDPLVTTRYMSLASLGGCVVLCRRWLAKLPVPSSWAAFVWPLVLGNGLLIYASLFGLETLLFTFILTLAGYQWWRWCRSQSAQSLALFLTAAVLAVSCRPEAPAWFLALFLAHFLVPGHGGIPSRRAVIFAGALTMLLFSAFLLEKFIYFGARLPNPFYVKSSHRLLSADGMRYVVLYLLWGLPLVAASIRSSLSSRTRELLPIALACLAFALVFVHFDPLMGTAFRFLLPIWPILTVLGVAGLSESAGEFGIRRWGSPRWRIAALAGCAWMLLWAGSAYLHIHRSLSDRNDRNYRLIGTALRDASPSPRPWIALGDQGALPYFSGWNTLDFVGLTTNEVARATDSLTIANFVFKRRPEVIVIRHRAGDGRPFIAHARTTRLGQYIALHPVFRDEYVLIGSIPDEDVNQIAFYLNSRSANAFRIYEALQRGIERVQALYPGPRQP